MMSPLTEKQKKGLIAGGMVAGILGAIGIAYAMRPTGPKPTGEVQAEVTGEVYFRYSEPGVIRRSPPYIIILPDGREQQLTEDIVGIRYRATLKSGTPPVYAEFGILLNDQPMTTTGDTTKTFSYLNQTLTGTVETKIPPGLDGTRDRPTRLDIVLGARLRDSLGKTGESYSNVVSVGIYEAVPPELEIIIEIGT